MAVKGSTAKGVGKKVKPAPKAKSAFKYYEPRAQGSASESKQKPTKTSGGEKAILGLYKPNRTGSISPRNISALKNQRAREASEARSIAYKSSSPRGNKVAGSKKRVANSEAAIKSGQVRSKKAISLVSTGERAPKMGIGRYRKVAAAVATTRGDKDYRRDHATTAAVEKRNATIHYARQKAARKRRG